MKNLARKTLNSLSATKWIVGVILGVGMVWANQVQGCDREGASLSRMFLKTLEEHRSSHETQQVNLAGAIQEKYMQFITQEAPSVKSLMVRNPWILAKLSKENDGYLNQKWDTNVRYGHVMGTAMIGTGGLCFLGRAPGVGILFLGTGLVVLNQTPGLDGYKSVVTIGSSVGLGVGAGVVGFIFFMMLSR